jgi:outer membrane protein assembly factor BamE (lipoprotein component of BamABCDE complex)
MKPICFIALLAAVCLSGCSTPGSRYAKEHPELPVIHRQILITGEISNGFEIEGMTKEQVRLAKGKPARVEKINGEDAWVYLHETVLNTRSGNGMDSTTGSKGSRGSKNPNNMGGRTTLVEKTTVLFQGDKAVQALVTED